MARGTTATGSRARLTNRDETPPSKTPRDWAIASGDTDQHVDILRTQPSQRLYDLSLEEDPNATASSLASEPSYPMTTWLAMAYL